MERKQIILSDELEKGNKIFSDAIIAAESFDGMALEELQFINCDFNDCSFNGAVLSAISFRETSFYGNTTFNGAMMDVCEMVNANFDGTSFNGAEFNKCVFDNVLLLDVNANGTFFFKNDLRKIKVGEVRFNGAIFTDCVLDEDILLSSKGYTLNDCYTKK